MKFLQVWMLYIPEEWCRNCRRNSPLFKVGNLKGYLFWPPFLKVFCQKWKFGRAKEMSASAEIWTQVPRSKGSYAIQWATPLLIENQQKLASYNNFCFGPFLTKNFQKGNGQNRYIFELLTLVSHQSTTTYESIAYTTHMYFVKSLSKIVPRQFKWSKNFKSIYSFHYRLYIILNIRSCAKNHVICSS